MYENDLSFLQEAPTKDVLHSPNWDPFGINNTGLSVNCVPCVAAFFRTLEKGMVVPVSRIKQVVRRGEFPSSHSALEFIGDKTGLEFTRVRYAPSEVIAEGDYVFIFTLPFAQDASHVVYMRSFKDGSISIYCPQGDYYFGATATGQALALQPELYQMEGIQFCMDTLIPASKRVKPFSS